VAANDHSGGLLLGIKHEVVEVGTFDEGECFIGALMRNMKDDFKWEVVVVYGPAQHKSEASLEELYEKKQRCSVPMIFGGDFNLIRWRGGKNNSNIDWRLVQFFNDFIVECQLQELKKRGE
jgi:hypothetical protein